MNRWIVLVGVVLGGTMAVCATPPAPLTSVRAIHSLSNAQASSGIPVAFQATVTYFRPYENTLFVEDAGVAIYVKATANVSLVPGDRVLVRGKTRGSFRPDVASNDITFLRHGSQPKPIPVSYDQAMRGEADCKMVTLRGIVRAADRSLSLSAPVSYINLEVLTDGGYVDVTMDSNDADAPQKLLDAQVEMTGVISGRFDGKMQQTGILLHVSGLDNMRILKPASASPWEIPVSPMDEVLRSSHFKDSSRRVRVQGTITYYQPGSAIVLQSGAKSLWIMTGTHDPLNIGDLADATGFPDVRNGFLALSRSEIRDKQVHAPIAPVHADWKKLASSRNIFDLVSIEGTVLMEAREATQDEYVLVSDGHLFSVIYRHANAARLISLAAMKTVPLGARVRVTGICMNEDANPFNGPVPFNILLREPADILVVARPSLLDVRNLLLIVGLLIAVVVAIAARGWIIEHGLRRETSALAVVERQRSRILEDINGARPLAEILEEIVRLVSVKLKGAPCWCDICDGARLGSGPEQSAGLRIAREEIPSRSGSPLGTIFAALAPDSQPDATETEALSMGSGLATLAIETRRLNSELRHRSEFDQLTDTHNRFSIERYLMAQIDEARQNTGIFGLIYIDMDRFKLVNDAYGHQVGDLFLQQVAMRMKRQLRPQDMLARLGGDEFAALVPAVRNRAEVEEIAQRLEHSLDEPLLLQGLTLHAAASVGIALYPEDGITRDALLGAADAGMYVAKHMKREAAAGEAIEPASTNNGRS